jgi:hypothetical protein
MEDWSTHSIPEEASAFVYYEDKAALVKRDVAPLLPSKVDLTMLLYSRKSKKDMLAKGFI